MANALYRQGAEGFLSGTISWTSNNVRMLLLNDQYEPDLEADEYLTDIPTQAKVATSDNLANKFATDGYAKSDPAEFPLLFNSERVTAAAIYKWTGSDSTSTLIAYFDEATGLPFAATGKDYYILYDLVFGGYFRF